MSRGRDQIQTSPVIDSRLYVCISLYYFCTFVCLHFCNWQIRWSSYLSLCSTLKWSNIQPLKEPPCKKALQASNRWEIEKDEDRSCFTVHSTLSIPEGFPFRRESPRSFFCDVEWQLSSSAPPRWHGESQQDRISIKFSLCLVFAMSGWRSI